VSIVRANSSTTRGIATAAGSCLLLAVIILISAGGQWASAQSGGSTNAEPTDPNAEVLGVPFDRPGMWIWYVSKSEGGSLSKIIARAKRSKIGTVYVKAGDSNDSWSQFNRSLIDRLHRAGLEVCAWQFVYGDRPVGEAAVGAAAVRKGADCLVIDAEGHYEGKYAQADTYVRRLRAEIGTDFPVSLATFPYVDYHPAFPYSVFMGPGGAQYNQPQMYWDAIGTTVRDVYEHTYLFNRVYERPIFPLGQTYSAATLAEIQLFRRYAVSFGGLAESWWSWQETSSAEWSALRRDPGGSIPNYRMRLTHPVLKRGSRGDLVVWAQQHLSGSGSGVPVTGLFGPLTYRATRAFQTARGIKADGVIGSSTWRALLKVKPVRVRWAARAARSARSVNGSGTGAPLSASMPARAFEIPPGPRR